MPKPVKKKKRFISKKESTTYTVVPGYVEDDDEHDRTLDRANETPEEIAARKEEERKYGVFFNDEYNYMKHLRSLDEQGTLVSTEKYHQISEKDERLSVCGEPPIFFEMFSTDVKEGEEIDAEILAALDEAPLVSITEEDLEFESPEGASGLDTFLDDDFIVKGGGVKPKPAEIEREDDEWSDEEEEDDDEVEMDGSDFAVSDDDIDSDRLTGLVQGEGRGTVQDDIAEAQTSLILRNFEEGLGFHFSNQVPDLEPEVPSEIDYQHLKYILTMDAKKKEPTTWAEVLDDRSERAKVDTSKYLYEDEDEFEWKEAPKPKPKFDCVSILSLNSNTRNLPTDILPPSCKPKKSQNQEVSDDQSSIAPANRGLTLKELEQEMRESRLADRASTYRPSGETAEEKRARKKAVKDERKERRQEKKANKQVFSMESEKMKKETAALAKSVKSVKIS
ncbi:protein LTV1 homolog [Elysia marginata]|uniref:Protein LTV1 homolog n=1 Tax=Elysia marginata TaxID=1093978 RepID=A0AAV4HLV9_9GAST|nr:protein LTV1 homolog [Elysia marginata]